MKKSKRGKLMPNDPHRALGGGKKKARKAKRY
jgi:hypothetical protein